MEDFRHFGGNQVKLIKYATYVPEIIKFHWLNKLLRQVAQKLLKTPKYAKIAKNAKNSKKYENIEKLCKRC